jgi:hypothetical protein
MVNHHLDTRRQSADPSHTVHSNVDDGRGRTAVCLRTDGPAFISPILHGSWFMPPLVPAARRVTPSAPPGAARPGHRPLPFPTAAGRSGCSSRDRSPSWEACGDDVLPPVPLAPTPIWVSSPDSSCRVHSTPGRHRQAKGIVAQPADPADALGLESQLARAVRTRQVAVPPRATGSDHARALVATVPAVERAWVT